MFTCTYCGKNAKTTNERNCTSPETPDGRHAPGTPQPGMIGTPELTRWRTVAADLEIDGVMVPQPEKIGQVTEIIEALFAYKSEAIEWAARLEASGEGWVRPDGSDDGYGPGTAGLGSAAVSYFGPTDAPGNCWSMRLERITEA